MMEKLIKDYLEHNEKYNNYYLNLTNLFKDNCNHPDTCSHLLEQIIICYIEEMKYRIETDLKDYEFDELYSLVIDFKNTQIALIDYIVRENLVDSQTTYMILIVNGFCEYLCLFKYDLVRNIKYGE